MRSQLQELADMNTEERQAWFDERIARAKEGNEGHSNWSAFYMIGVFEALFNIKINLHNE